MVDKSIDKTKLNEVDEGMVRVLSRNMLFTSMLLTMCLNLSRLSEFLFEHQLVPKTIKKVECLFSGLKNMKYQKYMSRPHLGKICGWLLF